MKRVIRHPNGDSEVMFTVRLSQYRKKPLLVFASQMDDEFEVETMEGTMRGKPGDWLICGVKGEYYPCSDEVFQATYEPVGDDKRRLKAVVDEE